MYGSTILSPYAGANCCLHSVLLHFEKHNLYPAHTLQGKSRYTLILNLWIPQPVTYEENHRKKREIQKRTWSQFPLTDQEWEGHFATIHTTCQCLKGWCAFVCMVIWRQRAWCMLTGTPLQTSHSATMWTKSNELLLYLPCKIKAVFQQCQKGSTWQVWKCCFIAPKCIRTDLYSMSVYSSLWQSTQQIGTMKRSTWLVSHSEGWYANFS